MSELSSEQKTKLIELNLQLKQLIINDNSSEYVINEIINDLIRINSISKEMSNEPQTTAEKPNLISQSEDLSDSIDSSITHVDMEPIPEFIPVANNNYLEDLNNTIDTLDVVIDTKKENSMPDFNSL